MDDREIVELYWARAESAVEETQKKYGKYCHAIAMNILHSPWDAEECVNDTYLGAWESMPPHKPERLSAFLGKITRRLAINRLIRDNAAKRAPGVTLVLDEVEAFIPDPDTVTPISEEMALRDALNRFLSTLPKETRMIFVRRYWYLSPIKEIAADMGMTEGHTKVILHRTRVKLKAHLEKEGITV